MRMNRNKKYLIVIFFASAFVFCVGTAEAQINMQAKQKADFERNELSVAMSYKFANWVYTADGPYRNHLYPGANWEFYNKYFGTLTVSYSRLLTPCFALTATLAGTYVAENIERRRAGVLKAKAAVSYYMIGAKVFWTQDTFFRVYSRFSAGIQMWNEWIMPAGSNNYRYHTSAIFSTYELVPVGFQVGRKWRFFGEFVAGGSVQVTMGIRHSF